MKINNRKEFNRYTRGQQFLARVLFIVWLLVGCPGSVLAMEKSDVGAVTAQVTPLPSISAFPDDSWETATQYVSKAKDRLQELASQNTKEVAKLQLWLGKYYKEVVAEHPEAIKFYKQSLKTYMTIYEQQDNHEVARAWSELGTAQSQGGNREDALVSKMKALEMRQRLQSGDDREVAFALNSVGELLRYVKGRLEDAQKYTENALQMRIRLSEGADNLEVARSHNSVGVAYEDLQNLEKALEHKQKGLAMQRRLLVAAAVAAATAASSEELATCQQELRNILTNISHPLHNVGRTLAKKGKSEEGLEHCQEGLDIRKKIYAKKNTGCSEGSYPDHTYIAQSLGGIGYCYEQSKEYAKAADYYKQAVAMALRLSRNKRHPHLNQYHANIISILYDQKSVLEVQEIKNELKDLYVKKLGPEDDRTKAFLAACQ